MTTIGRLAFALAVALALAACSEHETKTVERSVSPLIGTWLRDGDAPKPDANGPQFTRLTFAADGKLAARYVAGGGALAAVLDKAPAMKSENDTYTTADTNLRIAEGTRNLDFTFRVDGTKLYLTPSGASDAAVFTKAASS